MLNRSMPWQEERYPDNWDELAKTCKDKANWRCEQCGVADGEERVGIKRGRHYNVRLTAAHLDHDPENPSPRLMALCEVCHLRYDAPEHGKNARRTIYRKRYERALAEGQLLLFREEHYD